ncbi:MAG: hypothetical protein CL786_05725 [Chloroflexi bacterium]|nr:hypothetical protein [Chloroflexota bacterium]
MKIAVVGSGISGISAAINLHANFEISLFEEMNQIGGHSNSVSVRDIDDKELQVDTGFIVLNDRNYPNFLDFLQKLNVKMKKTDMSFSYTNNTDQIQYSGTKSGLFPPINRMFEVKHWRRLFGIYKYSTIMENYRKNHSIPCKSIGEFLHELHCPQDLIDNYFLPIASAIWSCDRRDSNSILADAYINFFSNHGLLQLNDRPNWYSVEESSRSYLNEFEKKFNGKILNNSKVVKVSEGESNVEILTDKGRKLVFDAVILATHSDTAIDLTRGVLKSQKYEILKQHPYTQSDVILHTDESCLPLNKRYWASWNVMSYEDDNGDQRLQTTYYMNRLQKLESKTNFLVTLNSSTEIHPSKVIYKTKYNHPLLTKTSLENKKDFEMLNAGSRIYFCGAYLGFGFHEDGYLSGKMVSDKVISDLSIYDEKLLSG